MFRFHSNDYLNIKVSNTKTNLYFKQILPTQLSTNRCSILMQFYGKYIQKKLNFVKSLGQMITCSLNELSTSTSDSEHKFSLLIQYILYLGNDSFKVKGYYTFH